MLTHRLATGLSLVAVFLLVLVLDELVAPWFPLWFVTAGVVMATTALEMVGLLRQTSAKPSGNTVFGGVLAMVIANWAPHITQHLTTWSQASDPGGTIHYDASSPINALAWPLCVFVAIVMFAFISQSAQFNKPGGTMASISGTVLATAYIGLLGSFILQTRWLPGDHTGEMAVACLVATAKGADIGAYTFGRIAGRRKLWPKLSPNKTMEGAFGGLVLGTVFALTVVAIGRYLFHIHTLGWAATVGYGLLVGSAAQLGDLMESMIKRDCAAKDASDALPGFGGVLDVMDSLLFAAPVAFGYWLIFGP